MKKIIIFDGYIDEPTCLGVPPFISPYPRYIAGSLLSYDKNLDIKYITIYQIRLKPKIKKYLFESDLIFIIAGITVPGKYLQTYPASPQEIIKIFEEIKKPVKILCGPAGKFGLIIKKKKISNYLDDKIFDLNINGDCEIIISDIFKYKNDLDKADINKKRKKAHDINKYAIYGANIVKQHPNYNLNLITEIETYRGCSRSIVGGCSFCCEPLKGSPDFRPIIDIINEIKELYKIGIKHFRLGNQPCLFSYMAKDSNRKE